jgi:branched-chain amino acid transport system substrate-binding protein
MFRAPTAKYLMPRKVPTVGIVSGSNKFTDVANHPLATTSLVSFGSAEGRR